MFKNTHYDHDDANGAGSDAWFFGEGDSDDEGAAMLPSTSKRKKADAKGSLKALARRIAARDTGLLRDRRWRLKTYKHCVPGNDLVTWPVKLFRDTHF